METIYIMLKASNIYTTNDVDDPHLCLEGYTEDSKKASLLVSGHHLRFLEYCIRSGSMFQISLPVDEDETVFVHIAWNSDASTLLELALDRLPTPSISIH